MATYSLIKEKGNLKNAQLTNLDTNEKLFISADICKCIVSELKKEAEPKSETEITLFSPWNFIISDELVHIIQAMILPVSTKLKPNKIKTEQNQNRTKEKVDYFNLIYGISD